jgi:D-hydroxyproline dehydrogenase subunit beta
VSQKPWDDAVVGAGILGLAHACVLAKRGRKVIVFERNPQAVGASIRNFGMLWPIGQPAGPMREIALNSIDIWKQVLRESGIWYEQTGSLHLAYKDDEAKVLEEFIQDAPAKVYEVTFLPPNAVRTKCAAVNPSGLRGGMWSPTEVCVDPRKVIAGLPKWLHHQYGVEFVWNCPVTGYDSPLVEAGGREWRANRLWVCAGDDIRTLYPDALRDCGLFPCKLQMMRSQPYTERLGPMLAAGLTLRHYASFRDCPTLSLLKQRVAAETPEFDRYGIHVMASQNGDGELVLGDSHEYAADITPFDKAEIDRLILDYLATFLLVPDLEITARWHGIYIKHPAEPYIIRHPAPNATIITAVGGAGMTLSFGLAEKNVREILDE